MNASLLALSFLAAAPSPAPAAPQADAPAPRAIRLPRDPQLSPDGGTIAFAWEGDVWTADAKGGAATRLTAHPATDSRPHFSPDGGTIYFSSSRSGSSQIWAMPADGDGAARQVTHDTNSDSVLHVTRDGLVVQRSTDRGFHYSESGRMFVVDPAGEEPARRVFDAGMRGGALSPDGSRALFVRGRSAWDRKGYVGPQAAQLWLADLSGDEVTYERLSEDREDFQNVAAMDPIWAPDGRSAYFMSDPEGVFDIYRIDLETKEVTQVTDVSSADGSDDGVAFPSMSADGGKLLYRRRFDLVLHDLRSGASTPIELHAAGDMAVSPIQRVQEERAQEVAFTSDGKQMAFVSANDLWVMDRILKEPRRLTDGEHIESSLAFSADGQRLFFVSDADGEADIHEASLAESANGIWWLPDSEISMRKVTDDKPVESSLALSPTGEHVAFAKGSDLFVMDSDGSDHRLIASMWSPPDFDWSPDGRWITYETQDDDYNSDVFVVPLDGTREPFNLSRHPDSDGGPKWSPDGKRIAWTGRRDGDEADIYWVELTNEVSEQTSRDETLEKALKAMEPKGGKKKPKKDDAKDDSDDGEGSDDDAADEDLVEIDFEDIGARIERFRNPDSYERGLIWFDGGEKLGFSGSVDGDGGFWAIEFPRPRRAERVAGSALSAMRWLPGEKEFVGHSGGVPASMSKSGKTETYGFEVRAELDWRVIRQAAFDQGWRAMRDRFYDPAYNNKDWYQIRSKYRPVAAQCLGAAEFSQLCNMMLGELNASHMGHRAGRDPLPDASRSNEWSPRTMHLGLRFDRAAGGPGLLVESVIPGSPCSEERSHVAAGERVLAIDGTEVGPDADLDALLTMADVRDMTLSVQPAGGGEAREVTVRPTWSVRGLLYPEFVEKTRERVEELSEGRLGYLHIQGMNFSSFRQMEQDLFDAGYGKDGLIIDVRFNGGGSTTDHVMTALTQPVHAITKSRGSGEGYPQGRKVYASWTKPIVLMCNEHSFSNAEILSHAVKQVGRGRLVGMRTAGGVISTGSVRLMDGSSVRMPMRGWYLASTGEDMELNGCMPDIAMWNEPDWDSPGGTDAQLATAVEALMEDVAKEPASPKLERASVKRKNAR